MEDWSQLTEYYMLILSSRAMCQGVVWVDQDTVSHPFQATQTLTEIYQAAVAKKSGVPQQLCEFASSLRWILSLVTGRLSQ